MEPYLWAYRLMSSETAPELPGLLWAVIPNASHENRHLSDSPLDIESRGAGRPAVAFHLPPWMLAPRCSRRRG